MGVTTNMLFIVNELCRLFTATDRPVGLRENRGAGRGEPRLYRDFLSWVGVGRASKGRIRLVGTMHGIVGHHERRSGVVAVLCALMLLSMGTVQAVHSHPDSVKSPRHTCSICSVPNAKLNARTFLRCR